MNKALWKKKSTKMQLIVFTVDPTEIVPKKHDLFNFGSWAERSFIFFVKCLIICKTTRLQFTVFKHYNYLKRRLPIHIGKNKFFVIVKPKQQLLGDSSNAVYLCNSCHQAAHELSIMRKALHCNYCACRQNTNELWKTRFSVHGKCYKWVFFSSAKNKISVYGKMFTKKNFAFFYR